jgi:hypothetical protein
LAAFIASLFYFGAKPILPLIVLWGVLYNTHQTKFRNLKFLSLFSLVSASVMAGYFYLFANSLAGQRLAEVGLTSTPIIDRVRAFLGFFSPTSLFLTGQRATDNYFMSNHGYFYLIEALFLFFGVTAILKRRGKAWLLFLLVAITVLPAALKTSGASIYSLRTALTYPLLCGIIGWGFYDVSRWIRRKFSQSGIILTAIGVLYAFSVAYFLFLYWHRLPREQATRWFFHERVVANYITRVRRGSDQSIVVLTKRPDGVFNSFVFFGGIYNDEASIREINRGYLSGNFEFRGTKFINDCTQISKQDLRESIVILDQTYQTNCGLDQKSTSIIANPQDAGGIFNIQNDTLCSKYSKRRFPAPRNIFDFKLENLSNEAFCNLWITDPENYTP